MRYRCPNCDSPIKINRLGSSRKYLISCDSCGLTSIVEVSYPDKELAFFEFMERYEQGTLTKGKDLEEILTKEGVIRSQAEIKRMVERHGLSLSNILSPVREILFTRKDYIAYYRLFEEEKGEYGISVDELDVDSGLKIALKERGISRLYKFQEEAIRKILEGKDVVIVAPTGNGKTEAFAIPIFHMIAQEKKQEFYPLMVPAKKGIRALFIYPTKSLSRDQLLKLKRMGSRVGISIEIFDGDTSKHEREKIYSNPPDILITNFDILHYHLSNRTELFSLLKTVSYVVVDELHEYTGAFGSNVYFILKRLERISGRFQIIGSSATIANPKEFAEALFDREIEVIECKKGKRGKMHFLMIYPSLRSHHAMIGELVRILLKNGMKTLIFSNSHVEAEVIKQILDRFGIRSHVHRAGLKKEVRRKVEQEFREGSLKVISATSTLELGIDIGDLDAVISLPIGLARFLQRSGRAGRRGQESLGILALRNNDPISAYYKRHPEKYFSYLEPIHVEPKNPVVARYQLMAAAMDKPIKEGEFREFSNILKELVESGYLQRKNSYYYPVVTKIRKVLMFYNIRGIGDMVKIYYEGKRIGEREMPMAIRELFPGAIYLHGGVKYKSKHFDFKKGLGIAELERVPQDLPYKTEALRIAEPEMVDILDRRRVYGVQVLYCKLRIREIVEGYLLRNIYTNEVEEKRILDKPMGYSFETLGIVFKCPKISESLEYAKEDKLEALAGAYHAVEHLIIECSDIYTGGGAREMGGISMGTSGVIFAYDSCPGGSGASLLLFRNLEDAFKKALTIAEECSCNRLDGCPYCTYSYQCGNNNRPLFKPGAIEALRKILAGEKTEVIPEEFALERPII